MESLVSWRYPGLHDRRYADIAITTKDERVLAIDEALNKLVREDPPAAELVKLRYFAGFSIAEAAEVLGVSRTSAYEQ